MNIINIVLQLFLGQIPEAIYFALFMIYAKRLENKRILFIILMICEYLLLKYFIRFNIWFQISYTIATYIILKILYKDKVQITDIFTFAISSFILIIINLILYLTIFLLFNNYIVYVIIDRILMFIILFLFHNKLNNIQKLYKKLWNRNDKIPKPIKSTTFRCINLVLFNFMFYMINIAMLYCIYINSK